jgi:unsaturated chondroitin disaccharide hydrolase
VKIDTKLHAADLTKSAQHVLELAGDKARLLEREWDDQSGAPVFTVQGQYTAHEWTEWTRGFQCGLPILAFDGTDQPDLLELGRSKTVQFMSAQVTNVGVHDHGFNTISTYGNLRRLMREKRIAFEEWEMSFYEMAIKASGAVQAARWSQLADGGYIYSFNGPYSLFIDTIRSLRVLALAHQLGQVLMDQNGEKISLLERLITHASTTAKHNIYYGTARDALDIPAGRGRTVQEVIFGGRDGRIRYPNTQQGYSPFSTWTRGLAWAILGLAEELEFLRSLGPVQRQHEIMEMLEKAARATADFYIDHATAADGIPYWDTGAPNLNRLGEWRMRNAEPFNEHEPVDSSAAAIAAQGLLRLGKYVAAGGSRYTGAGLTVARTLFNAGYLSESAEHQGLLLHSVYHRPNGWDFIPPGASVPCGESSLWGDYHAAELAIYLQRMADVKRPYYAFFDAAQ